MHTYTILLGYNMALYMYHIVHHMYVRGRRLVFCVITIILIIC